MLTLKGLWEIAKQIAQNTGDIFNDIGTTLSKGVETTLNQKPIIDVTPEQAKQNRQAVADTANKVVNTVGENLSQAFEGSVVNQGLQTANKVFNTVGQKLAEGHEQSLRNQPNFGVTKEMAANNREAVKNLISNTFNKTGESLSNLVPIVNEVLQEQEKLFGNLAPSKAIRSVVEKAPEFLTPKAPTEEQRNQGLLQDALDVTMIETGLPFGLAIAGIKPVASKVASPLAKFTKPLFSKLKEAGLKVVTKPTLYKLRRSWSDSDAFIKDMMTRANLEIENALIKTVANEKLFGRQNLYKVWRNLPGSIRLASDTMRKYGQEIIVPVRKYKREWNELMEMRRIEEITRVKNLPSYNGITNAQAQQNIENIRKRVGDDAFSLIDEYAKKSSAFMQNMLKYFKESGGISEANYQELIKKYPNYSRFGILEYMAETGEGFKTAARNVNASAKNVIQKLEGTFEGGKTIQNIAEANMTQIGKIVMAAERNKALQSFYNARNLTPYLQERLVPIEKYTYGLLSSKFKKVPANLKSTVENLIANVKEYANADEFADELYSYKDVVQASGFKGLKDFYNQVTSGSKGVKLPKGKESISLLIDGVQRELVVDEELANVLKGSNKFIADTITKNIAWWNNLLKKGATTYGLTFMLAGNPIRDYQTAKFVTGGKLGKGFGVVDWVRGLAETIKQGDVYNQFIKSLGGYGTYNEMIDTNIKKTAKEFTDSGWVKTAKTILNPLELFGSLKVIRKIGQIIEETPRVGVFAKTLKELQKTHPNASMEDILVEAAYKARNVTVDFAKAGNVGRVANLWVPFLNARIQDTLNLWKAFAKDPMRTGARATEIIGIPTIATYLWNRNFKAYRELDQNVKDKYFIIMLGTGKNKQGEEKIEAIKIPKGDAGRIFANPLEAYLQFLDTHDKPRLDTLALKFLSDQSPVSFERNGAFSGGAIVSGGMPAPVQGVYEWLTGVESYTGTPLVSQKKKNAEPYMQYKDSDPESLKLLAKTLQETTGHSFSPAKLYNFIQQSFGEVGSYPFILGDEILNATGVRPSPLTLKERLARMPVLRGFYLNKEGNKTVNEKYDIITNNSKEFDTKGLELDEDAQSFYQQYKMFGDDKVGRDAFMEKIMKLPDGEKIWEKMQGYYEKEIMGLDAADSALSGTGIENGERVKDIIDIMNKMKTPEEKQVYLDKLRQAGILTAYVEKQLYDKKQAGEIEY